MVDHGSTTTFTVTPDTGYSIASVTGCGGSLVGNTYITGPITADCTVTATFNVLNGPDLTGNWLGLSTQTFFVRGDLRVTNMGN